MSGSTHGRGLPHSFSTSVLAPMSLSSSNSGASHSAQPNDATDDPEGVAPLLSSTASTADAAPSGSSRCGSVSCRSGCCRTHSDPYGGSGSARGWSLGTAWSMTRAAVDRHKLLAVCIAVLLPLAVWGLFFSNYAPSPRFSGARDNDHQWVGGRKPNELYDGKLLDYRDFLLPNNHTTVGTVDLNGLYQLLHSLHRVIHAAAKRDSPETFVGLNVKQTAAYLKIGAVTWVENICETGFGGGHSGVALLYASESSQLHTFDIHKFSFSSIASSFVNKYFPRRMTLVVGDSKLTLPQYHALHPNIKCNVVHIDGHTNKPERIYDDIVHALAMADCRNVLIVPGVFLRSSATNRELQKRSEGVREAYLRARHDGLIDELGCYEYYEWLDESEWQHIDSFDDTNRQPTSFCLATIRVPACPSPVTDEVRSTITTDVINAVHLDKRFTSHVPITLPPSTNGQPSTPIDAFVLRGGAAAPDPDSAPSAAAKRPAPTATATAPPTPGTAAAAPVATAPAVPAGAWSPTDASEPALLMFVSGNGAIEMLQSSDMTGITWQSRTIALAGAKPAAGAGSGNSAVVWDTFVSRPCVTYQRHKQKYHMWYTGSDPDRSGGTPDRTGRTSAIGYAISAELPVFTRQSRAPVLSPTFTWERGGVGDPFVLWDEKKRQWRMWYSAFSRAGAGEDEEDAPSQPAAPTTAPSSATDGAAAASPGSALPGTNFNARLNGDANTPAAPSPAAGSSSASSRPPLASIGYAWSEDGLTWHKRPEPILRPNIESRTESRAVSAPYIVFRHGWYVMFYQSLGGQPPFDPTAPAASDAKDEPLPPSTASVVGRGPFPRSAPSRGSSSTADDPRSGAWIINAVRSRDGISNWEYSGYNPLVEPTPGSFDADSVSRTSALVLDDGHWSLWFVGVTDGDTETVAVTTTRSLPLFDDTN